jgi:adenylate kinase family enzyme
MAVNRQAMRKVALLGNAGGGKSTLGARLSRRTGIALYSVDELQWKPGGVRVADEEFERIHDEILARDSWIIDGFGTYPSYMRRLEAADTIILIDHALWRHYWWTARRNFLSPFRTPVGFPENTPLVRQSVSIAKFMWWVHKNFTPTNRRMIERYAATKQVFHLRSPKDLRSFCREKSL